MKKLMTVILSALMVITSLTCVLISPVSAATNLWKDISAADWYTRQVNVDADDPLTLPEKQMTDVYPEAFTYTSNGTFSLENAAGKHYYVAMPVLEKNKDYSLSFNYSVTVGESNTAPKINKILLVPESAFTNTYCWNNRGGIYSNRSFIGISDIIVGKALDSSAYSDTVTFDFNTKTNTQYYVYLEFGDISAVAYSNFKVVDPTDTSVDEEEKVNPAEVWTNLSTDDWYTRDIDGESTYSDGRDIPEKTVAERFGEDFTYNSETNSYNLKNANGRHYYIKMPVLAANKDYSLSFDYNVTPLENTTPLIYKVLLVPKSAFSSEYCWQNTTGEIFADRSWIGIQNIVGGNNPGTTELTAETYNDTLTYDFNTGKYTEYYLYIMFNGISEITYTNFSVIDPKLVEEDGTESNNSNSDNTSSDNTSSGTEDKTPTVNPANVWTEQSVNDWYSRDIDVAVEDGLDIPEKTITERYGSDVSYNTTTNSLTLKNAHGRHYYVKLPTLTKNKDYTLSFNYDATLQENTTSEIYKVLLVPKSAFSSKYCWQNTTGEIFADRTFIGISNIVGGNTPGKITLTAENNKDTITYDFNTGTQTEYYLYLMFNGISEITYSKLEVIDPELVKDDEDGNESDNSSSDNTSSDNTSSGTEDEDEDVIEVPTEDPANVWTQYSIDDWFTKQVDGSYEDGRNIPEKTASEKYGSDFTYDETTKSFKLKNAADRYYYVKLPKLSLAKNYTLSFDYIATLGNNGKDKFAKAILVPKKQFESEYCWNTKGEIWSDRTFVDIYDIVGGKDDGLAPGGITLTEENRKGNISYNFNAGKYDEYYVFFKFEGIKTVTYYNLKVIDPTLKEDYEGSCLNYGSVTPKEFDESVKAGDTVEFTAKPFKGNTFEAWYDESGNVLSTDKTFTYTVPSNLAMPKPKFISGTPAVENASLEDSAKGLLAYYNKSDNFNKVIVDDNYDVEYIGTPSWEVNIQAHTERARTGTNSIKIQTQYAYSGRHFTGLEKNTDYTISFWAYIQDDSGLSLNAIVLPKGVKPYKENSAGNLADYPAAEAMGAAEKAATATSSWQEVIVNFNSGENTDVTLWFLSRGNNSDRCWVDDLAIFTEATSLDVVADLGGSVTATEKGCLPKDTEITVTATPDKGNSFKHWLDKNGMVVSNLAEYTFTLTEDTYLKAVFGGYNKPARELFALRGDDGTFENGTISGIYAADITYPDSLGHCKTSVSTAYAYEGEKSLEVVSYYRGTIIPLTGLNKNTDYKFSYYIKYPYNGPQEDRNNVNSMMIVGADDIDGATAKKVFAEANSYLAGDAGWYKVELYFNTGDAVAANFILRYAGEPNLAPKLYMDNVALYEYYASNELANGSMTDTVEPWLGDGTVTADNTLKLSGKNTTAYQLIGFEPYNRYTVKFRAKGNIFASASDVSAKVPNIHNALSSNSYVTGNSAGFKEYTFEFYTGIHKGVALLFSSLGGDAFIDNVTVTKELTPIGGVIENIDFETERFALTHTDSEFYEIYTAKSANDANVHGGKKSLHFKYSATKTDVEAILDEAYLSYGVATNRNYKVSLFYKFNSKDEEALVNIEPNYRASYYNGDYGDYSGDLGYEQAPTGNEWKQLQFVFTATEYGFVKTAIYNIVGKTDADFYIDDIKITVSSDLVVDENAEKTYTTDFYNIFTNPSFEKKLSEGNWPATPSTMQIIKSPELSDTADCFLKVNKGTKYILPIQLNPSEIYYFGVSIKSINGGKGRIYLATLTDPTTLYFTDLQDNPKSIITADSSDWKHEGFGFRSSPTGETFMVIECTEGAIGLDTVSLTLAKHANSEDYNEYYPHIPFDYDNIDPSIIVYNGGITDEDSSENETDTPDENGNGTEIKPENESDDSNENGSANDSENTEGNKAETNSDSHSNNSDDYAEDNYSDDEGSDFYSPSTGDKLTAVYIVLITGIIAAAFVLIFSKRKDEADV